MVENQKDIEIGGPMEYPKSILLVYWGRIGLNFLVKSTMQALVQNKNTDIHLWISKYNSDIGIFSEFGEHVAYADVFESAWGSLNFLKLASLRHQAAALVRAHSVTDVVTLMPHVWSFPVASAFRGAGARYHTILHDAARHPGDLTGLALPLLLRDAKSADTVLALSDHVASKLLQRQAAPRDRLQTLFHPVVSGTSSPPSPPSDGEPWRFLFLGRIMPYKGLSLFVDAMTQLKADGLAMSVTVMGDGPLGAQADRLTALGARVVNRWLDEHEIADALANHHAMILSHIEASQSGVAALALGAALPVVTTPVGGIKEQVSDGLTGLVARDVSAVALAEAIQKLVADPDLYARLAEGAAAARAAKSPGAFADALLSAIARGRPTTA